MRTMMTRRRLSRVLLGGCVASAVAGGARSQPQVRAATLYKDPECGCCEGYGAYLGQNGFRVTVVPTSDLSQINRQHGVPPNLEGCHLTLIDPYVIGGHVPIGPINRLLAERPNIRGITLPGMPLGSPGMAGPKTEPFTIYEVSSGSPRVYAVE